MFYVRRMRFSYSFWLSAFKHTACRSIVVSLLLFLCLRFSRLQSRVHLLLIRKIYCICCKILKLKTWTRSVIAQ